MFGGPRDGRPWPGGVQGHRRQQASVSGQDCATGGETVRLTFKSLRKCENVQEYDLMILMSGRIIQFIALIRVYRRHRDDRRPQILCKEPQNILDVYLL